MKKAILAAILFFCCSVPALADNCSAYPYILLNGQTADANQVMANFNSILSCGNNQLLSRNNNLSDLQSAATARTNLGLGTASIADATDEGYPLAGVAGAPVITNDLPYFGNTHGTIQDSGIPYNSVLTQSGNLAGLSNAATARTNLGLGSIAVQNVTYSTSAPSGSANTGDLWIQYVP